MQSAISIQHRPLRTTENNFRHSLVYRNTSPAWRHGQRSDQRRLVQGEGPRWGCTQRASTRIFSLSPPPPPDSPMKPICRHRLAAARLAHVAVAVHKIGWTTTVSPTARPLTPSPYRETVPENSCSRVTGDSSCESGCGRGQKMGRSRYSCRSLPQVPYHATSIFTARHVVPAQGCPRCRCPCGRGNVLPSLRVFLEYSPRPRTPTSREVVRTWGSASGISSLEVKGYLQLAASTDLLCRRMTSADWTTTPNSSYTISTSIKAK